MRALICLLCLAVTMSAEAAELSMRDVVTRAKAAGPVKVIDTAQDEDLGLVTEIGSDVFCAQAGGGVVEYCYPYGAIAKMVKPGTGAHRDFTTIWVRSGR